MDLSCPDFSMNTPMVKRYSWKFWFAFWMLSALVLGGWYIYLQAKNNEKKALSMAIHVMPKSHLKSDLETLLRFTDQFSQKDGKTHTFLILFQNQWELRPGGGYIGSFGIAKVQDGSLVNVEVHDTSNFDGRIPDGIEVPYPMQKMLNVRWWKLRDSNYSPDFPTNARRAESFYRLGGGEEQIEAVIGVTGNVLITLLSMTGPVEVDGVTYSAENVMETLEHQVEVAYIDRGLSVGDRKASMRSMANAIAEKIQNMKVMQEVKLGQKMLDLLQTKDIQIYMKDIALQNQVVRQGWSGSVDETWNGDYFALVDANLGALKTDRVMQRSVAYSVDLSKPRSQVTVQIRYTNTAQKKDWMTHHYSSYSRVYVPEGVWLDSIEGVDMQTVRFGSELSKKYFGFVTHVPLGQSVLYTLHYTLPTSMQQKPYDLKIQKQPGSGQVAYSVAVKDQTGASKEYTFGLDRDMTLRDMQK